MVDRACLRDINITSVGKQLTILRCIQELLSKDKKESQQNESLPNVSDTTMKVKITKKDKKSWTPEQRALYQRK